MNSNKTAFHVIYNKTQRILSWKMSRLNKLQSFLGNTQSGCSYVVRIYRRTEFISINHSKRSTKFSYIITI